MTSILTIISNTTFLKGYFLTVFSFQTLIVFQEAITKGFYEALVNNTPAQVFAILGVIAGTIWILRMADDAWTNHLMNKSKSKTAEEKAEQEEIETDLKRKDLNDK